MKAGVKPNVKTLIEAVSEDNVELVKLLVDKKVPLNKLDKLETYDEIRTTPLTRAISFRRTKMIKLLLDLGADPSLGKGKESPLAAAIEVGSLQYVKTLIAAGAKVAPVVKGQTLEATAKAEGHKDIASYFARLEGGSAAKPAAKKTTTKKTSRSSAKKAVKKPKPAAKKTLTKTASKSAAKKKAKGKQRRGGKGARMFELSDGKSNKFWEIRVSGASLTTRFGRIGTDGQSKTKSFADAAACEAEANKLIRQKTGKGYDEV